MTKRNPEVEKAYVVCGDRFYSSIGPKITCSIKCSKTNGDLRRKEWTVKKREKLNAYQRAWRKKNLEKSRAISRKSMARARKQTPRIIKSRKLKSSYGITIDQLEAMIKMQDNKCAICKFTFDLSKQSTGPNIDHDHRTNIVRMILCRACNNLLGYADDDISILRKSISYLEKHNV